MVNRYEEAVEANDQEQPLGENKPQEEEKKAENPDETDFHLYRDAMGRDHRGLTELKDPS